MDCIPSCKSLLVHMGQVPLAIRFRRNMFTDPNLNERQDRTGAPALPRADRIGMIEPKAGKLNYVIPEL